MSRQHGTNACYVWGPEAGCLPGRGCRCTDCSLARGDYEKTRRSRVEPSYVDATEVRQHVNDLMAYGVGIKTISKRSGISTGVLSKLIYGDRPKRRGPSKRIRPATRDALLAVKRTDQADGARVPAGPTWKVIDHLLGEGWTKAAIARAIGQTTGGLQLSRDEVAAGNARAIAALLDQPVPARRSRWGEAEVRKKVETGDTTRERQRKAAEAERRREYRHKAIARAAIERGEDPYELPDLFAAAGDWMRQAPCRHPAVPNWLFFPAPGDQEAIEAAKAVCATCPVRSRCGSAGQGEGGIWGGLTENERTVAAAS